MNRAAYLLAALAASQLTGEIPARPGHASLGAAPEAEPAPVLSGQPLRLGAASNFSQGWNEALFEAGASLSLLNWRDSIRWADVEKQKGRYDFTTPMTRYPAQLGDRRARLTLTLNWGNPLYDAGQTPHSPEALAAFGRFVAEVVRRYPAVDTLEIGNEINGGNFVNGPVKAADPAGRRAYHLAMVRSAAQAARAVRPSVRVIGGSTHSLPGGFLWPLLDQGGSGLLDGLAVHPYTTPIDQLPGQIAVLRRHAALRRMPLYVTELGSRDPAHAADELVRSYATLSSLGVTELDWYTLNDRGDGFVPLLRPDGGLTEAGKAFRFVMKNLASVRGRDRSPDDFTFVHAFGPDVLILWGAPRGVSIDSATVTAFDATGAPLDPARLTLAEDSVLILKGTQPLTLGGNVSLGCSPLVADSFHGFTYPAAERAPPPSTHGFAAYVRRGGSELPLVTLPGQQSEGVPWVPYLGRRESMLPRVMADSLFPAPGNAVVLRYVSPADRTLRVEAAFTVSAQTEDGIEVTLESGRKPLSSTRASTPIRMDRLVPLRAGQDLTFLIGAGRSAHGDNTTYRIRLFDEASCKAPRTARR